MYQSLFPISIAHAMPQPFTRLGVYTMRWFVLLIALGFVVGPVAAQSVIVAEDGKVGDLFRYDINLSLKGAMKVERNGKPESLPIVAQAAHSFAERTEAIEPRGTTKTIRHYEMAKSQGESAGERSQRELAADRRLIVAERREKTTLHFSPDGPLAREELELVAEHFDTLALASLLPGKLVALNDTWTLRPDVAQSLCALEGLVKAELVGKITEITAEQVKFTITGNAEGIDNGASVKLSVNANGIFSVATKRLTNLTWVQTDDRAQGAANPASEVQATVTLTRQILPEEPKTLDITARAKMPSDPKATSLMTMLRHTDSLGRFQFLYPRDWHIVGRTKDHVVLRLLEDGEFVAQATLTCMKKLDVGTQLPVDDFKKLLTAIPGWEPEGVSEDGIIPTDNGRRLFRLTASGKQDGVAVQQTFYHLAGPNGDQVAVTVLAKADRFAKVGSRDLSLVNAVEFPKK
jgi:hypothetical protein